MQQIALPPLDTVLDSPTVEPAFLGEEQAADPSLPAIFLTATFALLSAGITFYVAHRVLAFDLVDSFVLTLIGLTLLFGPLGIAASLLVGSPALAQNVGYGCGLMIVALLFFAVCLVVGALAAIFAVQMGLSIR